MTKRIDQERHDFKQWAENQGGIIEPLTSEFEVGRVRHPDGVLVIYRGKQGISFSDKNVAKKAWEAFKKGHAFPLNKRHKRTRNEDLINQLKERDDYKCWFCGAGFDDDNKPTIEHLLSVVHGGNNNPNNLVLACSPCNYNAGSLSISKKVGVRDSFKATQQRGHNMKKWDDNQVIIHIVLTLIEHGRRLWVDDEPFRIPEMFPDISISTNRTPESDRIQISKNVIDSNTGIEYPYEWVTIYERMRFLNIRIDDLNLPSDVPITAQEVATLRQGAIDYLREHASDLIAMKGTS